MAVKRKLIQWAPESEDTASQLLRTQFFLALINTSTTNLQNESLASSAKGRQDSKVIFVFSVKIIGEIKGTSNYNNKVVFVYNNNKYKSSTCFIIII